MATKTTTKAKAKAKSKVTTRPFDVAEYLDTPGRVAAYIEEALETGDAAFIAHALGVVAKAQGMSQIADRAGLSRESLYRALSTDGNPEFATVLSVLKALKMTLKVEPSAAVPL